MEITIGQAAAFVDAIAGSDPVGVDSSGDEVGRPRSPVAHAHVEAVLGTDRTPYGGGLVIRAARGEDFARDRLRPFADYLGAVAAQLRAAIDTPVGE